MADLVAQVAEHGPVGLAHLLAHRRPVGVVGLGQVEGDDAVGVPGGHRLGRAREQVEGEPALVAVARADRQPELAELEQQPALRRLGHAQLAQPELVAVGGPGAGERAGEAELALLVDEPVAAPRARRWRTGGPAALRAEQRRPPRERDQLARGQSKPSAAPQLRQASFSKKTSWPQLWQAKARIGRSRVAAAAPPDRCVAARIQSSGLSRRRGRGPPRRACGSPRRPSRRRATTAPRSSPSSAASTARACSTSAALGVKISSSGSTWRGCSAHLPS